MPSLEDVVIAAQFTPLRYLAGVVCHRAPYFPPASHPLPDPNSLFTTLFNRCWAVLCCLHRREHGSGADLPSPTFPVLTYPPYH